MQTQIPLRCGMTKKERQMTIKSQEYQAGYWV